MFGASASYSRNRISLVALLHRSRAFGSMEKTALLRELSDDVLTFINKHIPSEEGQGQKTFVVKTSTRFNIDALRENNSLNEYRMINLVNLKRINEVRRINKFFNAINSLLPKNGIYVGRVETYRLRKIRVLRKYPWGISHCYHVLDSVFKRIFPRVRITQRLYFFITRGRNRAISKAEALGRVVSCGFEIIDDREMGGFLYFVVKKVREPFYDKSPSYGPIYKMSRVGKNGKMIGVYKFRTMHPYSEYLQDYVLRKNGYSEIGKPANDFRLTSWGKFMRKLWLDEIPQLINVFKGEMKLVGVRPVSQRFLDEYPEDIKALRLNHKPGCVPPYVALLKQDVSEYIESERTYLLDVERHPYTADIRYFLLAAYNIFTNKIRSS